MVTWDCDQLQADIRAVYAKDLPIPPWWPAEDRAAFIDYHAAEAASALIVELDNIVDRVADQRHSRPHGRQFWGDEIAATIAAEQEALIDEASRTVMWDLTDAIAEQSAWLTAEAVFAHPGRGQSRVLVFDEKACGT